MKLENVTPVVLTFVLIGILVAVGLTVLLTFEKTTAGNAATTTTSTVTWGPINTVYNLTNLKSVTSITNTTNAAMSTANYAVVVSTTKDSVGTVTILNNETSIGGCTQGGGALNCTITYLAYNYNADAPTAVNSAITATSEFPNNWMLIIMVVIAAAIVVGLIVKSFANER